MKAIGISNGYISNTIYIIWDIPYDNISGYDIYRNGTLIASSFKEEPDEFVHPTLFDRDHQTNLFKKDSTHQLMYVDTDVEQYQKYEYKVIATYISEDKTILDSIESNTVYIKAL